MNARKSPTVNGLIKVPRFDGKAGFHTTQQRARLMSKIKAKDSKAEMLLRRALYSKGIRYRTHRKDLPGKPDIAIQKYRLAIFVDGAFWHGYGWEKKKTQLKTNTSFWIPKIERNMQRDTQNRQKLEAAGYTVMRFWDHEIVKSLEKCVNQILLYLESARQRPIPVKN